jgi:hypothetical protein
MCEKERKEVSSVAIAFFLCGLCGRQSIDWCMAERGDRRHVLFVTPDVALSPHQQPRRSVEFPLAPRQTFNLPRINYLWFRPRYAPDVDTSTIANHLPAVKYPSTCRTPCGRRLDLSAAMRWSFSKSFLLARITCAG